MDAKQKLKAETIRIGTLVNAGGENDPANYIRQIAPHGFESYSITFWQTLGDTDLTELAKKVVDACGESGATIGSVGVFGNPLGERPIDVQTRDGWSKLVDAAPLFGTTIVAGFAGRVVDQSIDKSLGRYAEVFGPIASRAQDNGLKLAFENCDMGGTWERGDWTSRTTRRRGK